MSLLKEILVGLIVGFVFIVVAELVESGLELCDIVGLETNQHSTEISTMVTVIKQGNIPLGFYFPQKIQQCARSCLLYTSDAADE